MKNRRPFVIGLLFIIFLITTHLAGVAKYLTFERFIQERESLIGYVENNYVVSVISYIMSYVAVVVLSLPAALLLTLIGGFLFGTLLGAIYANIGATVGACISFFLVRYSFGDFIQQKYGPKLAIFNEQFNRHGAAYLLAIHFVAFIPFFMTNIFAGMTRVHWFTFLWTTSVGIFPTALLYTYTGQRLAQVDSFLTLFTPELVGGLLLLSLVTIVSLVFSLKKEDLNEKPIST